MAIVAVTGLYTHETNLSVAGFPLEYAPVYFPFHGVTQSHAGVGLNVSVALSCLGNTVGLATYIGSDDLGDQIISALPRFGLTDKFFLRCRGDTSQSAILVLTDGNRQTHCALNGLQNYSYPREQIPELLDNAQLVVVCNINFARPVLAAARERGIPVATNVHVLCVFDGTGEVAIDHAHDEHQAGQKHQDLGGVVEKELQCAAQVTVPIHWQARHQRFGGRIEGLVQTPPDDGRQDKEEDGSTQGPGFLRGCLGVHACEDAQTTQKTHQIANSFEFFEKSDSKLRKYCASSY
jgi:hypothetical protein